jgi:hypothetical protein
MINKQPSVYDVVVPCFRQSMVHRKEQDLENLISLGLPVEQYFIFFQESITWLREKNYIDNLRYLELAQFLDNQKKTMPDMLWYKERLATIMNAVSKPILFVK